MPPRSQLPGEIKRKKFIKALERLDFIIDTRGGSGSHIKATWPRTQKAVTLPSRLTKNVLYYLLKEIEACSGITWKDIKKVL